MSSSPEEGSWRSPAFRGTFWSMKAHFGLNKPGAYSLSRLTSKHKATSNSPGSQLLLHTLTLSFSITHTLN